MQPSGCAEDAPDVMKDGLRCVAISKRPGSRAPYGLRELGDAHTCAVGTQWLTVGRDFVHVVQDNELRVSITEQPQASRAWLPGSRVCTCAMKPAPTACAV